MGRQNKSEATPLVQRQGVHVPGVGGRGGLNLSGGSANLLALSEMLTRNKRQKDLIDHQAAVNDKYAQDREARANAEWRKRSEIEMANYEKRANADKGRAVEMMRDSNRLALEQMEAVHNKRKELWAADLPERQRLERMMASRSALESIIYHDKMNQFTMHIAQNGHNAFQKAMHGIRNQHSEITQRLKQQHDIVTADVTSAMTALHGFSQAVMGNSDSGTKAMMSVLEQVMPGENWQVRLLNQNRGLQAQPTPKDNRGGLSNYMRAMGEQVPVTPTTNQDLARYTPNQQEMNDAYITLLDTMIPGAMTDRNKKFVKALLGQEGEGGDVSEIFADISVEENVRLRSILTMAEGLGRAWSSGDVAAIQQRMKALSGNDVDNAALQQIGNVLSEFGDMQQPFQRAMTAFSERMTRARTGLEQYPSVGQVEQRLQSYMVHLSEIAAKDVNEAMKVHGIHTRASYGEKYLNTVLAGADPSAIEKHLRGMSDYFTKDVIKQMVPMMYQHLSDQAKEGKLPFTVDEMENMVDRLGDVYPKKFKGDPYIEEVQRNVFMMTDGLKEVIRQHKAGDLTDQQVMELLTDEDGRPSMLMHDGEGNIKEIGGFGEFFGEEDEEYLMGKPLFGGTNTPFAIFDVMGREGYRAALEANEGMLDKREQGLMRSVPQIEGRAPLAAPDMGRPQPQSGGMMGPPATDNPAASPAIDVQPQYNLPEKQEYQGPGLSSLDCLPPINGDSNFGDLGGPGSYRFTNKRLQEGLAQNKALQAQAVQEATQRRAALAEGPQYAGASQAGAQPTGQAQPKAAGQQKPAGQQGQQMAKAPQAPGMPGQQPQQNKMPFSGSGVQGPVKMGGFA